MSKRKLIAGIAVLLLIAGILFFFNAGSILTIPLPATKPADLIVILGGDTGSRTIRGLELCTFIQGRFENQVHCSGFELGVNFRRNRPILKQANKLTGG